MSKHQVMSSRNSKKASKSRSKSKSSLKTISSPSKVKQKNKSPEGSQKGGKQKKEAKSSQFEPPKSVTPKKDKKNAKTVAKIPAGREDSSSNWKALLLMQGKPVPTFTPSSVNSSNSKKMETKLKEDSVKKPLRGSVESECGSDLTDSRSNSQSRCPSQLSMSSEAASSVGADVESDSSNVFNDQSQKVKQEFRALGLPSSKAVRQRPSRPVEKVQKPVQIRRTGVPVRKLATLLPRGLNEFGFFSYSHYGVLKTPLTPDHTEFMKDTGIVAMDCEMVGVGPMRESALARVSIVNEHGFCLYDRFVKPKLEVTDYRTEFSGIRESDLKNAVPFQTVVVEVSMLLKSHILVGHSLRSDLGVLYLSHPKARMRDTAFYFKKLLHCRTPKLKNIVKRILNVDIQQGEHSSITDAQATMALYLLYQDDWEISMKQSNRGVDVFKETIAEFHRLQEDRGNVSMPPPSLLPSVNQPKWYDEMYFGKACNQNMQNPTELYGSPVAGSPLSNNLVSSPTNGIEEHERAYGYQHQSQPVRYAEQFEVSHFPQPVYQMNEFSAPEASGLMHTPMSANCNFGRPAIPQLPVNQLNQSVMMPVPPPMQLPTYYPISNNHIPPPPGFPPQQFQQNVPGIQFYPSAPQCGVYLPTMGIVHVPYFGNRFMIQNRGMQSTKVNVAVRIREHAVTFNDRPT